MVWSRGPDGEDRQALFRWRPPEKKDFQTAREYAAKAAYPNAWLIKVIEEALKRK